MSALLLPALAAGSSGQGALYVDDVFSTYLYTGNGSTQAINNGIDLAGKGGMVWLKGRSGATDHALYDTLRGATFDLISNSTAAQTTQPAGLTAFGNSGFSIGSLAKLNTSAATYASWTFRRAPKFFDVVTFTTNGSGASGVVSHSLGQTPGMMIVKRTTATDTVGWAVYHRSLPANHMLLLHSSAPQINKTIDVFNVTASTFSITNFDASGSYVAYLFAHDPSAEGIIQCGSFTTDASGNATVNLGWEPQFLLSKRSVGVSADVNWHIWDQMRGLGVYQSSGNGWPILLPNQSTSEEMGTTDSIRPAVNSTGFTYSGDASTTYIYLAIRRPNKPPTTGTQVYNASTASGVVNAGFPIDLHIGAVRAGAANNHAAHARLTGGAKELVTSSTSAESTITDLGFDSMIGLKASLSAGGINHFFRRAPGFFDVVTYTGDGTVPQIVRHGLTVVPELVIIKNRSVASGQGWPVFYKGSLNNWLRLDATQNMSGHGGFASLPTSTTLSLGYNLSGASGIGNNYVAYLFATLSGISKVDSYTGNGSSQTINCGFTTGARFILIKRTDATGDWYVWDSVRGIVAANDPHLSLNTTAAEVTTDDSVDPEASGFIVNQNTATNINVMGGQYIFLAIA